MNSSIQRAIIFKIGLNAGANDASPQVRGFCFDALGVCRLHIQSRAPAPALNIQTIAALPTATAIAIRDEPAPVAVQQTQNMYNSHPRHVGTASVFKSESAATFEHAAPTSTSQAAPAPPRAESNVANFAPATMRLTEFTRGVDSSMSATASDATIASVGHKRGRDALEHVAHPQGDESRMPETAANSEVSLKRPHTYSSHPYAASANHETDAKEAAVSNVVIVNEEPDEAEEGASLWNL